MKKLNKRDIAEIIGMILVFILIVPMWIMELLGIDAYLVSRK